MKLVVRSFDSTILDTDYLAAQTGGDPDFAYVILDTARGAIPGLRAELVQPGDIGDLFHVAHQLRGMLGMLGASTASVMAGAIETATRNGNSAETASLVQSLDLQLGLLLDAVDDVMEHMAS